MQQQDAPQALHQRESSPKAKTPEVASAMALLLLGNMHDVPCKPKPLLRSGSCEDVSSVTLLLKSNAEGGGLICSFALFWASSAQIREDMEYFSEVPLASVFLPFQLECAH